jgi:hypothetical protein
MVLLMKPQRRLSYLFAGLHQICFSGFRLAPRVSGYRQNRYGSLQLRLYSRLAYVTLLTRCNLFTPIASYWGVKDTRKLTNYNQQVSFLQKENKKLSSNKMKQSFHAFFNGSSIVVYIILCITSFSWEKVSHHVIVSAFKSPFFTMPASVAAKVPTKTEGIEIEMPNFDELFGRIQKLSPLAQLAIESKEGGFAVVNEECEYRHSKKRQYVSVFPIVSSSSLFYPRLIFRSSR